MCQWQTQPWLSMQSLEPHAPACKFCTPTRPHSLGGTLAKPQFPPVREAAAQVSWAAWASVLTCSETTRQVSWLQKHQLFFFLFFFKNNGFIEIQFTYHAIHPSKGPKALKMKTS